MPLDRDDIGREPRRNSSTATPSGSMPYGSDDDQEYDLDVLAVSDGFRPTNDTSGSASVPPTSTYTTPSFGHPNSQPHPQDEADIISPVNAGSKGAPKMANRPSSVSKSHRPHDSLTLQHDGRNPSSGTAMVHQPQGQDGPVLRLESPYQGPSGPSHPYAMYMQRTLSNATDNSRPRLSLGAAPAASQSFNGSQGPAHPYALYTQSTTPEEAENAQQYIPVGFNGMNGSYTRQLGPDGEEVGGLIGPLGHMEELPPYTKYPPAAYVANRNAAASPPHSPIAPATPTPAPPGAGGLGMATRNPEFSSTEEDLALPYAQPSNQGSMASINEPEPTANVYNEKSKRAKWQRRAKKRVCGVVPYWAICLLISGIVVISIILGAVIGRLLVNHNPDLTPDNNDYNSGGYQLNSPDLLTQIPAGLPSLATGSFGLPPLDISQAPKLCFNDTTQARAWDCDVPYRYYSMQVLAVRDEENSENQYMLNLDPIDRTTSRYIWGTRPPNVSEPVLLNLVNDSFEPGRGPAWWLRVNYNKTVTVPEEIINIKRRDIDYDFADLEDYSESPDSDYPGSDSDSIKKRRKGAVDGDRPWICTWPDTTLEVFIYPSQNVSMPLATSASAAPTPTSTVDYFPDDPFSNPGGMADSLPSYPNVVKFLERRLSREDENIATCRQVQVFNNSQNSDPVLDEDGNPIEITIIGKAESRKSSRGSDRRSTTVSARDVLELTDCGCLWWST